MGADLTITCAHLHKCDVLVAYERPMLNISKLQEGTIPKSSEHGSAQKGGDQSASQVGCDDEVDELGLIGYSDVERKVFDI